MLSTNTGESGGIGHLELGMWEVLEHSGICQGKCVPPMMHTVGTIATILGRATHDKF